MAVNIEIKAKKRIELGKKSKRIRRDGLVPAVVYGRKFSSTPISIDTKEFTKKVLRSEAGENLIFNLVISDDGEKQVIPAITHNVQIDPLTDEIIHLDLMHVIMDEVIRTEVPVELTGVPAGVKDDGGVLVHGLRDIEIKCLPGDIPDKYVLDVTELKINGSLHVSDIKVSGKIEILTPKGEMLAMVSPPTKEEEAPVATPEEAAAAAAVAEGGEAVAEEQVKEKSAPGAAPAKAAPAKAAPAGKQEKGAPAEKK